MTPTPPSNEEIAEVLEEVGDLLEAQKAVRYRVAAYRKAAQTIRTLPARLVDLWRLEKTAGLTQLPTIGPSLAGIIGELLETGTLGILDRLRGEANPEALFATVPGIGVKLAAEIHERLGLETLEELEVAAHDGRLDQLPGFGSRRLRGVVESLAGRLGVRSRKRLRARLAPGASRPDVSELLDVDREYRDESSAGRLREIAPRRFNPERRAWLPILHADRRGRHYTAMFSNTARAHELGKTHDWVVLYFEDEYGERQATIVTEYRGELMGRRVVRGREPECIAYYRELNQRKRARSE